MKKNVKIPPLKSCPFCGGAAAIFGGSILIDLRVVCEGCQASSKELGYYSLDRPLAEDRTSKQWEEARVTLAVKVAELWNKRA